MMTQSRRLFGTSLGLAFALLLAICVTLTAAWVFQDNISRFVINPRTPFQTSTKPPAPDYTAPGAWILNPPMDVRIDNSERLKADIFYIHNAALPNGSRWNVDINDAKLQDMLKQNVLPNEVGPFIPIGNVYAPHYRAAALYASFTHKYDGLAAYEMAYTDVKSAFATYLEKADNERPLILIGYGQGALMANGLLKDFVSVDPLIRRRLVAAYLIDRGFSEDSFQPRPEAHNSPVPIPICNTPKSTGCVVTFNTMQENLVSDITEARRRTLIWDRKAGGRLGLRSVRGVPLACVNPLNWQVNGARAQAIRHKGAASATGLSLGQDPTLIKQAFGGACVDGVLIVDNPTKPFLRRKRWFGKQWRNQPFNLFFGDLRADALRRFLLHAPILAEDVRQLPPIEGAVDFTDSPIKKVPN